MEKQTKYRQSEGIWAALALAWELGYIIAIPAAVFSFGGAYLDKYADTSPLFLLMGIALAVALSGLGIYRRIRKMM